MDIHLSVEIYVQIPKLHSLLDKLNIQNNKGS